MKNTMNMKTHGDYKVLTGYESTDYERIQKYAQIVVATLSRQTNNKKYSLLYLSQDMVTMQTADIVLE